MKFDGKIIEAGKEAQASKPMSEWERINEKAEEKAKKILADREKATRNVTMTDVLASNVLDIVYYDYYAHEPMTEDTRLGDKKAWELDEKIEALPLSREIIDELEELADAAQADIRACAFKDGFKMAAAWTLKREAWFNKEDPSTITF